jgi:hypothetical protein
MKRGNAKTGEGFALAKETPGPGGPVYMVRLFHRAPPFTVEWVYKRHFVPETDWHLVETDDLIVMTVGTMRLEFQDSRAPVTLTEGECIWLPAGTVTRGIALPMDGTPCAFLSVAAEG